MPILPYYLYKKLYADIGSLKLVNSVVKLE